MGGSSPLKLGGCRGFFAEFLTLLVTVRSLALMRMYSVIITGNRAPLHIPASTWPMSLRLKMISVYGQQKLLQILSDTLAPQTMWTGKVSLTLYFPSSQRVSDSKRGKLGSPKSQQNTLIGSLPKPLSSLMPVGKPNSMQLSVNTHT